MNRLVAVLAVSLLTGAVSAAGFQDWVNVVHMADKNGDGMVSHDEVMDFHDAKAVGFQPFMVDHWKDLDTNGDGMVSMDEIKVAMKKLKMTDKDMLKAFFEKQGFQPAHSN